MRKMKWKVLLVCFLAVFSVAIIGGLFTSSSVNSSWYQSIKPSFTPPNYVFPIVWNVLFFLISISLYLALTSTNKKQIKRKIAAVFGMNLLLNFLWSFLFFAKQNPFGAFFDLVALWITIVAMIYTTYKVNKTSAYLLIPYLLWVSFAGFLNWAIAF